MQTQDPLKTDSSRGKSRRASIWGPVSPSVLRSFQFSFSITEAIVMLLLVLGSRCTNDSRQSVSPDYLKTAKRLEAPLVDYVDAVNTMPVKDGQVVKLSGETPTVAVTGWAIDNAGQKPGRAMGTLGQWETD